MYFYLRNDVIITVIVMSLSSKANDRLQRLYGSFKKTSSLRLHSRIRAGHSLAILMKNTLAKRQTE